MNHPRQVIASSTFVRIGLQEFEMKIVVLYQPGYSSSSRQTMSTTVSGTNLAGKIVGDKPSGKLN
jgi:hypothetical protein